jgi:DNA-binding beta-propeller fold protein YncE
MDLAPHKLIVIDGLSHTLLIVDGTCNAILAELPLPPGAKPVDLVTNLRLGRGYIALIGNNDEGLLYSLDFKTLSFAPLLTGLPKPAHITAAADGSLFMADAEGFLYVIDQSTAELKKWAATAGNCCVGLATSADKVFGVWEANNGGMLAVYDTEGNQLAIHSLGGCPTGITSDNQGRIFIPFTSNQFCGEGIFMLDTKNNDGKSTVIHIQCSRCSAAIPVYPLGVAISADGQTLYVACESSASLLVVDIPAANISRSISVGRSISKLALLPGEQFCIASSNVSADLCLIDLVNFRPVSFTATDREILSPLAIVN